VDFVGKKEGVVFIDDLHEERGTSAVPERPQKPSLAKEWERGRRSASWRPTLASCSVQLMYSFW